jgi:hypothetical protein
MSFPTEKQSCEALWRMMKGEGEDGPMWGERKR